MNSDSVDPSFLSLAEEYLRRRRAEGTYSLVRFADEFPHVRETILEEFPVLLAAESFKEESLEASVSIPKAVGRYKVGREIGRGAMGIVVSASNPDLESKVAIKLLPFERKRSIDVLKRFHVEAKICAAMDHPNIVPVFDYGTDEQFAYLVMRRVLGKSLDKVIAGLAKHSVADESGGIEMDWNFVTSIGIQAADALQYAHDQGVIHRDIKPANLILEPEGRLWVSDFGLSKVLSSDVHLSMTGDVVGTPKYMAPEQLRGVYNASSDVYSLGMTLYELAALQPFSGPGMSCTQLLADKPTFAIPDLRTLNPAVPDALYEVIMQAVELNPDDRFTTANELSIALKQSVEGTFIGDRRIKDRATSRRNLKRNVVIAICAGLIASVGVYMLGPNLSDELASALSQPDKLGEILDQEESRQVVLERIPELIETAIQTEDKEVRALFADFATAMFEPPLALSGDATEQRDAADAKDLQRILDAYVESGLKGPGFRNALQVAPDEGTVRGRIQPEVLERVRDEVRDSEMSDEWKEDALKQVARYQNAIDNQLLSKNQQWRIKNFLVSLYCEKGSVNLPLSSESLRFFITVLKNELDLVNASVADPQQVPSSALMAKTKPPLSSPPTQDSPDLNRLLIQALDDPRSSTMINKVIGDQRLLELLNKVQEAKEE